LTNKNNPGIIIGLLVLFLVATLILWVTKALAFVISNIIPIAFIVFVLALIGVWSSKKKGGTEDY
jgi:uncharacterized protein YacL